MPEDERPLSDNDDLLTRYNMETVKYVCEFFFGNFWHWLGLFILISTIFSGGFINIFTKNKKRD